MNVAVSNRSTVLTLVALAAAVAVYLFVPPAHRAVNEVARILTTADAQAAILGFRDYLLGLEALMDALQEKPAS